VYSRIVAVVVVVVVAVAVAVASSTSDDGVPLVQSVLCHVSGCSAEDKRRRFP